MTKEQIHKIRDQNLKLLLESEAMVISPRTVQASGYWQAINRVQKQLQFLDQELDDPAAILGKLRGFIGCELAVSNAQLDYAIEEDIAATAEIVKAKPST